MRQRHTTTTTRVPLECTWKPPTVQPCFCEMSATSGISFCTLISCSLAYFCSNNCRTSSARIFSDSGILAVEIMPWNHGAMCGMKATEKSGLSSVERWVLASRSWIWSVTEYALTPPRSVSGAIFGTEDFAVPAPEYPEMPNTVGCAEMYGRSGARSSWVFVL